jgi:hypothetical protein
LPILFLEFAMTHGFEFYLIGLRNINGCMAVTI